MPDEPITPHAGPVLDREGRLTYLGIDGRRYVVGLPPGIPEPGAAADAQPQQPPGEETPPQEDSAS